PSQPRGRTTRMMILTILMMIRMMMRRKTKAKKKFQEKSERKAIPSLPFRRAIHPPHPPIPFPALPSIPTFQTRVVQHSTTHLHRRLHRRQRLLLQCGSIIEPALQISTFSSLHLEWRIKRYIEVRIIQITEKRGHSVTIFINDDEQSGSRQHLRAIPI